MLTIVGGIGFGVGAAFCAWAAVASPITDAPMRSVVIFIYVMCVFDVLVS